MSGQRRPRTAGRPGPVILLTGFDPFGGESINPSGRVVAALQGETIAGARVQTVCLPTVFGAALQALGEAVRRCAPVLVVALGQAGGRSELSIERVAINVDDARIPDNDGAQPIDEPIVPGGPAAYFSTLPVKAIVAALHAQGLPAGVSQTAGTFVCNHVFYGLQHLLAGTGVRSGFVHLPWLPEQAGGRADAPCLPLDAMVDGVRTVLQVAMTHRGEDLRRGAGALD
jgi:pyroglutamyl-peptidase